MGQRAVIYTQENPPSSYPLPLHVSPLNVFDLSVLADAEMLFCFFVFLILLNAKQWGPIFFQILLIRLKTNNTAWGKRQALSSNMPAITFQRPPARLTGCEMMDKALACRPNQSLLPLPACLTTACSGSTSAAAVYVHVKRPRMYPRPLRLMPGSPIQLQNEQSSVVCEVKRVLDRSGIFLIS